MYLMLILNYRLRFLIAIPKLKPSLALAISKKYSTMRSLLNVYMDPSKTVSATLLPCSIV